MRTSFRIALMLLCGLTAPCFAQTGATPSQQDIIEALTPAPAATPGAPLTRGLRNLKVQRTEGQPGTASPAPSISLSIQFDFDSAHIRAESLPALQNLAGALGSSQLQEAKIRIEGHTDAKGRSDYNLRLSTQRAEAVSRWLIQQGISESRLQAVGLGSTQPADPDPLAAANRRVRIVNLQ